MKRLILSLLLIISSVLSYAQVGDRVTWVAERDKYVVTLPKAVVYEIPGNPDGYSWWVSMETLSRGVIYCDEYKKKSLKKPQTLLVRGYANRSKQLEYDTYVVEYKEKRYLLPCEYVEDCSLISGVNSALKERYETLVEEMEQVSGELKSLVRTHTNICNEKIAYYKGLQDSLPAVIDSVRNNAKEEYQAKVRSNFEKWYNALPKSTKNAYAKLSITDAGLSSPNSASGCDYTFVYTNKSKKTIKYLYGEGDFYNAVNDPVYCEIRGYGSFRGQDTGPVESGESGGGVWDCVIYNWSADYVKLTSVTIIYMDGTSTTIGAADIWRLLAEPTSDDLYDEYGSEYDYVNRAALPLTKQLYECDGEIRTWQYRLNYLQNGNYTYAGYERGEYEKIFETISRLYNKSRELKDKLSKFETKNLLK